MKIMQRPVAYYNDIEELVGSTIKKIDGLGSDQCLILTECGKMFCICSTDFGYNEPGSYLYDYDGETVIENDHIVFFGLLTEDELTAIEEQEDAEWEISNDKRKKDDLIRLADSLGYNIVKKEEQN